MSLIKTHLHLTKPRHAVFAETTRPIISAVSACLVASAARIDRPRTGLNGRLSPRPRPCAQTDQGFAASSVLISILCGLDR